MFEGIIGNNKIKKELELSVKLDKTSHSYLFIGKSGIGKKLIAKEFSKMLLCLDKNKYCNKCKSCIEFESMNNPDFSMIEPDNNSGIKIEQIRDLQRKVIEKPIISQKKVYIINDADLMTVEAQNCLLKTLEEPPKDVTIILIGENEGNFLNTIKSRCMIIHFNKIDDNDIKLYLQKKYGEVKIPENMLKVFDGSIRKAELLKNNEALYNEVEKVIINLEKYDIIDILKLGESIYNAKEEIYDILEYINIILLDLCKKDYRYANCVAIVESTKTRIKANSNYNMSIDYMLFGMWREVNEEYNRS